MNTHKIKLIGLNYFFVRCALPEQQLASKIRAFERKRGERGFFRLKGEQRYALIKEFCETENVELVYASTFEREIKVRERDHKWVKRRLEDAGYKISLVQLQRYIKNKLTPDKPLKFTAQNVLEFHWD